MRNVGSAFGAVVLVLTLVMGGAAIWLRSRSAGHIYDPADAPPAPVVIVPGAQIRDGKPLGYLEGRLDSALRLIRDRKVRAVLVSGNADGESGDEIAAMTDYLVAHGVDRSVIVGDPYGLDTYDSCARAKRFFGVDKAVIISQPMQLHRAVVLCRALGVDADGVTAQCHCGMVTKWKNNLRELLAGPKAVFNIVIRRGPHVVSAPTDVVHTILAADS